MRQYAYLLVLCAVVCVSGCGIFRELLPSLKEGLDQAGPVPGVSGPQVDYVVIGSYVLNVLLGSWAAYERRQRRNGQ